MEALISPIPLNVVFFLFLNTFMHRYNRKKRNGHTSARARARVCVCVGEGGIVET